MRVSGRGDGGLFRPTDPVHTLSKAMPGSARGAEQSRLPGRSSYQDERARIALDAARRMSSFRLTMAWGGAASALVYVFFGADLSLLYGTLNVLIGIAAASILFGVMGGILAAYAVRTGSSSSALSLVVFGSVGGAVPTLVLALAGTYYAVFEGSVLAVAGAKVIPGLSYPVAALIVVLYSAPLAAGGVQRFLDKLNGLLLPFYLSGLLLILILIIAHALHLAHSLAIVGPGRARVASVRSGAIWRSFTACFGFLVLMMVTMDFARFGRMSDQRYHARVAFGVPFYLLAFVLSGFVGVLLVAAAGPAHITETSVVDSSLAVLGATGGLAWVFVTQTRINLANFYVSTLNLQAALEELLLVRVPRIVCALAVAITVLILMRATDVFSYLLTALAYQGVFITAWAGVALAHVCRYPLGRGAVKADVGDRSSRGHPESPRFQFSGIAAWLVSVTAGTCLMLAPAGWTTLSAPATLVLAACLYWLMQGRRDVRGV